ncbi:MAG: hypothetical protein FJ144_23400 [Deltaproteobacteria bacterium]|nr:hypothetical protein [Deltaproteobacteria bacterium]
MTKFIMGLLLGLILGIGGTAAFLITAQGGDYLVATSPRVRELEATLKQGDSEREWLRHQLRESSDSLTRLESRFVGLSERFDRLGGAAAATSDGGSATSGSGAASGGAGSASGSDATASSGDLAETEEGNAGAEGAPSEPASEPTPEGPSATP